MKALTRRGVRLAVMTLGLAGLFLAINAVPGSATNPSGIIANTLVARGTYVSHGSLRFEHGLQVVVVTSTIAVGGFTGWHSHPGGEIIGITQGQLTFYQSVSGADTEDEDGRGGKHCQITTYTAGQSFINPAGDVHYALNTGSIPAIAYVVLPDVPVVGGLPRPRIDAPDPGTCPGI